MKILFLKEKGRNLANKEFSEVCDFQRALYRQFKDIDVVIWGLNWNSFKIPFTDVIKNVDVILLLENYDTSNWIPDLSKINKLKLFWSIDSHCVLNQHIDVCNRHKINVVLNSNPYDCAAFRTIDRKSYEFLSCYPSDLVFPLNTPKIHNIGFCGNVARRGQWLQFIHKQYNAQIDIMKIGADMVHCINSYKIHFNKNISHEMNGRVFETLGCKTFLLTCDAYKQNEAFQVGKHFVVYKDVNDLNEKVNYYLTHEKERKEIEDAGFEYVINNHSFDVRCKQLIQIIKENI